MHINSGGETQNLPAYAEQVKPDLLCIGLLCVGLARPLPNTLYFLIEFQNPFSATGISTDTTINQLVPALGFWVGLGFRV